MFEVLVESNRKGRRDISGTIMGMFSSTIFQAIVVVGAVYATMGVAKHEDEVAVDTIRISMDEPKPQEQKPKEEQPVITSLAPPPKGFQVLSAPVEIPTSIPPVDLSQHFDPRDYTGVGQEGGVFSGVVGGTGPVVDLQQVFSEAVVDEVPERISCPMPEYPRMMQQASISGQVLLQFVVETDGHVKPESIETLSSSNRAFEIPAREMIAKCLFRPGRVRASPVRVLVQMPVIFNLQQTGH
jgi:protein TonB